MFNLNQDECAALLYLIREATDPGWDKDIDSAAIKLCIRLQAYQVMEKEKKGLPNLN